MKLNATFVIVYVIFLTIVGLGSFGYHSFNGSDGGVFIPWEQFLNSFSNILYLVAAICLCFFMPGYALVKMLLGKNNNEITKSSLPLLKRSLPRYLISYFFSMLITGLTVYILASEVEFAPAQVGENGVAYLLNSVQNLTNLILLIIYSLILIFFVIHQKVNLIANSGYA